MAKAFFQEKSVYDFERKSDNSVNEYEQNFDNVESKIKSNNYWGYSGSLRNIFIANLVSR